MELPLFKTRALPFCLTQTQGSAVPVDLTPVGHKLRCSLPKEQQHPSQTRRAKEKSLLSAMTGSFKPLAAHLFINSPRITVLPRISEQIQPPPLAVSICSTPLNIFLCYGQDPMLFLSSFGAVSPWLPSPLLPSPAAPSLLLPSPSPARSPAGHRRQPNSSASFSSAPEAQTFVVKPPEKMIESS